jgi:hypothetical protein
MAKRNTGSWAVAVGSYRPSWVVPVGSWPVVVFVNENLKEKLREEKKFNGEFFFFFFFFFLDFFFFF